MFTFTIFKLNNSPHVVVYFTQFIPLQFRAIHQLMSFVDVFILEVDSVVDAQIPYFFEVGFLTPIDALLCLSKEEPHFPMFDVPFKNVQKLGDGEKHE